MPFPCANGSHMFTSVVDYYNNDANESCLPVSTPCVVPFHADSGHGRVICFSWGDIGKCDSTLGLTLLAYFCHPVKNPSLASSRMKTTGREKPSSPLTCPWESPGPHSIMRNTKSWLFKTIKSWVVNYTEPAKHIVSTLCPPLGLHLTYRIITSKSCRLLCFQKFPQEPGRQTLVKSHCLSHAQCPADRTTRVLRKANLHEASKYN